MYVYVYVCTGCIAYNYHLCVRMCMFPGDGSGDGPCVRSRVRARALGVHVLYHRTLSQTHTGGNCHIYIHTYILHPVHIYLYILAYRLVAMPIKNKILHLNIYYVCICDIHFIIELIRNDFLLQDRHIPRILCFRL